MNLFHNESNNYHDIYQGNVRTFPINNQCLYIVFHTVLFRIFSLFVIIMIIPFHVKPVPNYPLSKQEFTQTL